MKNIDVCYTVVSLDQSKWGIEGDFYAKNEDDAIIKAKEQAEKFGAKRQVFYSFLKDSEELNEFIKTNSFIE